MTSIKKNSSISFTFSNIDLNKSSEITHLSKSAGIKASSFESNSSLFLSTSCVPCPVK